MLQEVIILIGLTLLPFLELRASIPYGILQTNLHWGMVFLICAVSNIILAPVVFILLQKFAHLFQKVKRVNTLYKKTIDRTQKKIHPYVDRYGTWGLALFIGVPLPGSGVYSGALGAWMLGMHFKDFLKAAIIGVLIAGVVVTAVVLTGNEAVSFFTKTTF